MNILLLIGFSFSLFLFILLLSKKQKAVFDTILLLIFLVYAFTIGGTYIELYNAENNYPFPHLTNFNWLFLFLHGPLLWLYVKSLTNPKFTIRPVHFLHAVPFVVYSVYHLFTFLHLSAENKIFIFQSESYTQTPMFTLSLLGIAASGLGYNIAALVLLKNHQKSIRNNYSNIEHKDLQWLQTLVIASLSIFIINVLLYNLNNHLRFTSYRELSKIAYSFSTFYVFYIAYFGIKQGRVFSEHPLTETVDIPFSKTHDAESSAVYKPEYNEIIVRLHSVMEHQQPYLDPELTLTKLSGLLNIKPETLTSVLNSSLNRNFFDFINKYRVEEFKVQCLKPENRNLSIIGIAYDCGFNSKAAFYRAFKKFEGLSPGEYIAGSPQK